MKSNLLRIHDACEKDYLRALGNPEWKEAGPLDVVYLSSR